MYKTICVCFNESQSKFLPFVSNLPWLPCLKRRCAMQSAVSNNHLRRELQLLRILLLSRLVTAGLPGSSLLFLCAVKGDNWTTPVRRQLMVSVCCRPFLLFLLTFVHPEEWIFCFFLADSSAALLPYLLFILRLDMWEKRFSAATSEILIYAQTRINSSVSVVYLSF